MPTFIEIKGKSETSLKEAQDTLCELGLMSTNPRYLIASTWVLTKKPKFSIRAQIQYFSGERNFLFKQIDMTEVLTLEDFIAKAKEHKLEFLLGTL